MFQGVVSIVRKLANAYDSNIESPPCASLNDTVIVNMDYANVRHAHIVLLLCVAVQRDQSCGLASLHLSLASANIAAQPESLECRFCHRSCIT